MATRDSVRLMPSTKKLLTAEEKRIKENKEWTRRRIIERRRMEEQEKAKSREVEIEDQKDREEAEQARKTADDDPKDEETKALVEQQELAKKAAKQAELDRQAEKQKLKQQAIDNRKEQQDKEKESRGIKDGQTKALVERQVLAGLEEVEAAIRAARRFLPTTPATERKSQLMATAETVTLKLLDMLKEELKAAVAAKKKSRDTLERLLQIGSMFQKHQDLELDELQEKAQDCMDEMETRRKVQQIWETSANITDASMVIGGKDLKFDPMSKKQLEAKEQEFREFVRNEDDRVQTKREQDEDRIMARKALEAERKALREAEEFEKAEQRRAEKDRQETKRKRLGSI